MKLDLLEQAISADTPAEKLFVKNCEKFGINPSRLHSNIKFVVTGDIYEVIGLEKRGRLYYILAKNKKFLMPSILDIRKINDPSYYIWVD